MQVVKALYAFYSHLFYSECEHKQVETAAGHAKRKGFCPDCGYKIALLWTICRCRTCGSKRQLRKNLDGRVMPLSRYCQHCGEIDYQIVKKEKINVHEMPYALLSKEIDYSEERLQTSRRAENPFQKAQGRGFHVVEGEVVRQEIIPLGYA